MVNSKKVLFRESKGLSSISQRQRERRHSSFITFSPEFGGVIESNQFPQVVYQLLIFYLCYGNDTYRQIFNCMQLIYGCSGKEHIIHTQGKRLFCSQSLMVYVFPFKNAEQQRQCIMNNDTTTQKKQATTMGKVFQFFQDTFQYPHLSHPNSFYYLP